MSKSTILDTKKYIFSDEFLLIKKNNFKAVSDFYRVQ